MWPDLDLALRGVGRLDPPAEVLEAGTGQGGMLSYLLELLAQSRSTWRLTTVDVSPSAAEAARRRIGRLPSSLAARVTVTCEDVVNVSLRAGAAYDVVVASALLSAVPLHRPFAQERVLASLARLVRPGGRLFVEDYLPLAYPSGPTGDPADPAETARALWRLDQAVAVLAGRPHYAEIPAAEVRQRLREMGFDVEVSLDERQAGRSDEALLGVMRSSMERPVHLDEALWAALDRYRRRLLATIADTGLVQWSGWYRLSAVKL